MSAKTPLAMDTMLVLRFQALLHYVRDTPAA